jgi:CRISPR-associated protein Csb2
MTETGVQDRLTWFCWQVTGEPRPSLLRTLMFGEAVRAAVMRAGNRVGLTRMPDDLHGVGDDPHHRHAYWLSEDRDGDGRIDHVTLHAGGGIPAEVVPALLGVGPIWLDRTWTLVPQDTAVAPAARLCGPARRWRPAAAYVTPLWRLDRQGANRRALNPTAQLRREIGRRGLPTPLAVHWSSDITVAGAKLIATDFVCRTRVRHPPDDAWLGAPTLTFAEAVTGPLAFGFGAHFGLGLLLPDGM